MEKLFSILSRKSSISARAHSVQQIVCLNRNLHAGAHDSRSRMKWAMFGYSTAGFDTAGKQELCRRSLSNKSDKRNAKRTGLQVHFLHRPTWLTDMPLTAEEIADRFDISL